MSTFIVVPSLRRKEIIKLSEEKKKEHSKKGEKRIFEREVFGMVDELEEEILNGLNPSSIIPAQRGQERNVLFRANPRLRDPQQESEKQRFLVKYI